MDIEHLIVFPHNPLLSDHYLITFEFLLLDYKPLSKNSYSRCLSDSAVAKFKEEIPSVFNSMPYLNITESYIIFIGSLQSTFDYITPKKLKIIKLAPWYNQQTHQLKQGNQEGNGALLIY